MQIFRYQTCVVKVCKNDGLAVNCAPNCVEMNNLCASKN